MSELKIPEKYTTEYAALLARAKELSEESMRESYRPSTEDNNAAKAYRRRIEEIEEIARLTAEKAALKDRAMGELSNCLACGEPIYPEQSNLFGQYHEHCPLTDKQRIAELERQLELHKGAVFAQDERERIAAEKLGMVHCCDWPDMVADLVLELRHELAEARKAAAVIRALMDSRRTARNTTRRQS